MSMAVAKPNAYDQRVQSVLFLMDKLDTKFGIDGQKGDFTVMALRRASQSMGMGAMGSAEDMRATERALLDKLKDPKFRENALEKLKQIDPPTRDSITAMQVVLEAAGHKINRDFRTGMVSGKMDEATRFALDNTENGKPNAAAFAAIGISQQVTQFVLNQPKTDSPFNQSFQTAVAGPPSTPAAPQSPAAGMERKSGMGLDA